MKNLLFILGLCLLSPISHAQSNNDQLAGNGLSQLLFVNSSEQAIQLAKQDILSGTPFLLLQSGIISTVSTTDKFFETKYKIAYYDFGCLGPEKSYLKEYNKVIFQYLNEKYGKDWLKQARKDTIGLKELTDC